MNLLNIENLSANAVVDRIKNSINSKIRKFNESKTNINERKNSERRNYYPSTRIVSKYSFRKCY